MAINKNFFLALNEMVSRASGVDDAGIVDDKSFIDFGKKLSEMDTTDFENAFAKEIANKVRLVLDIIRGYEPKFQNMVKGNMPAGGILEIIQHNFMEVRMADFTALEDGSSPDQWIVKKATQTADYFVMESAFSNFVTISGTELEGAFVNPQAMATFLEGKITYLMNSYNLAREQGRRSLLATNIADLGTATAATGNEDSAQRYKLVTLYNTTYGLTGADVLTADDALYSEEFVKFAVRIINKVWRKISIPTAKFNDGSIKTFTPESEKRLKTVTALDNAITAFRSTISPDATVIPAHESVDFWQKENNPLIVSFGDVTIVPTDSDRGTEVGVYYQVAASGKTYTYTEGAYVEVDDFDDAQDDSPATIAILYDDMRMGEYVTLERTIATPTNARALYYNLWQHYQGKFVTLKSANAVIFTLE